MIIGLLILILIIMQLNSLFKIHNWIKFNEFVISNIKILINIVLLNNAIKFFYITFVCKILLISTKIFLK